MKWYLHFCNTYKVKLLAIFFVLLGSQSFAQTFFGVSSSPVDGGAQAGPTVAVTPPALMQAGDLVIIYAHYRNTGVTFSMNVTGGQTWNAGATTSGSNQSYFISWCRFNGTWAANPAVTIGAGTNDLTAVMYVYRPSLINNSWGVHVAQANSSSAANPNIITGVATTLPRTVTMAFWGSAAANTWGTLAGVNWFKTGLPAQHRNTTSGQSHTAAYNLRLIAGPAQNVAQTQSAGTTALRAIMSWVELSNDLCANAIPLTSSTSCTNIAGNMFGATLTVPTINAPDCATGVTRDVWYRFVAQTTNPTISLSSVAFASPGIQLLSNNCGSTFNSFYCGTTSIAANHLTPGTTYYIRVYSTDAAAPASPFVAGFNICITDPVTPTPPNDECVNAANLTVTTNCNNVNNDMSGATPSSPVLGGLCTGPLAYDVWYRFTAVNNTATVNLSNIGANFLNPGIEVFSGNCGSLVSIACGNSPLLMSGTLTAGATYYVRVYSRTAPAPNGNARFDICVTSSLLPIVRFGNSYVNISKQNTGGVVQPGDTLEIRMMLTQTAVATLTNARFVDNIPSNTAMLTGASDRIRIITNEGLPYKQYTLAGADDPATYLASPPGGEFNIRVNLGFGASLPGTPANNTSSETASATGTMVRTNFPRGSGALLFAVAYRVVVTGAVGNIITLNPAQFIYRNGGGDITLTGTPYQILISDPLALCSNSTGLNNAVESGGTFGSGTTLNRSTDLTTPILGYSFVNNVSIYNQLGDGRYAIVKNISPRSGTNRNANRVTNPAPLPFDDPFNRNNRMFNGHWYPDGDHSGTTNAIGNIPPAAATNSGYMLMVNADYVPSEVYRQTLTNLCPNTYYEFSAWVRNICPTCGSDSTGAQFTGTPTAPTNGYPGVYPNFSFEVDGIDYYNSGQIDTTGWLKRGFVFLTGPSQTSATLSIRNNSQGGGGNDFVIDDVGVATCLPGLNMRPSNTPTYCLNGSIDLSVAVSTFYNNYSSYQWERNTGSGWGPAPELPGIQTFSYTYSAPNYLDTVAIPTFIATGAMNGYQYRIRTATTLTNLSNDDCSIYNTTDIITLNVNPTGCNVLPVELLAFHVKLNSNNYSELTWAAKQEQNLQHYEIERSLDGRNFTFIGKVDAKNTGVFDAHYIFNDPKAVTGKVYYRLKMIGASASSLKYSNILSVSNSLANLFEISSLVNPFQTKINFQLSAFKTEQVELQLTDALGHPLVNRKIIVSKGANAVSFDVPPHLQRGSYLLRIVSASGSIYKIVQKQ